VYGIAAARRGKFGDCLFWVKAAPAAHCFSRNIGDKTPCHGDVGVSPMNGLLLFLGCCRCKFDAFALPATTRLRCFKRKMLPSSVTFVARRMMQHDSPKHAESVAALLLDPHWQTATVVSPEPAADAANALFNDDAWPDMRWPGQDWPDQDWPNLIGRDDDLCALQDWLAADAELGAKVVWGEHGCGKTRLALALARHASDRGMTVVRLAPIGDPANERYQTTESLRLPIGPNGLLLIIDEPLRFPQNPVDLVGSLDAAGEHHQHKLRLLILTADEEFAEYFGEWLVTEPFTAPAHQLGPLRPDHAELLLSACMAAAGAAGTQPAPIATAPRMPLSIVCTALLAAAGIAAGADPVAAWAEVEWARIDGTTEEARHAERLGKVLAEVAYDGGERLHLRLPPPGVDPAPHLSAYRARAHAHPVIGAHIMGRILQDLPDSPDLGQWLWAAMRNPALPDTVGMPAGLLHFGTQLARMPEAYRKASVRKLTVPAGMAPYWVKWRHEQPILPRTLYFFFTRAMQINYESWLQRAHADLTTELPWPANCDWFWWMHDLSAAHENEQIAHLNFRFITDVGELAKAAPELYAPQLAWIFRAFGNTLLDCKDPNLARPLLEKAFTLGYCLAKQDFQKHAPFLVMCLSAMHTVDHKAGDPEHAEAHILRTFEILDQLMETDFDQYHREKVRCMETYAQFLADRGRTTDQIAVLRQALALSEQHLAAAPLDQSRQRSRAWGMVELAAALPPREGLELAQQALSLAEQNGCEGDELPFFYRTRDQLQAALSSSAD
jgi:hypothetical protein